MRNEIINYESIISWESGEPIVVYREMLTKEVISDLSIAALSLPYRRTDKEIVLGQNIEFEGKSNAEVMHILLARKAASGSIEAIKMLQDRILGKPLHQIKSFKITETYADYLERLTIQENEKMQEANVNVF